ncbi:MAG: hypothetical protein IKG18_01345 [Atopobiaceae bacterium]|nr:hypothetical protein [Atopobiaceae bacterium]
MKKHQSTCGHVECRGLARLAKGLLTGAIVLLLLLSAAPHRATAIEASKAKFGKGYPNAGCHYSDAEYLISASKKSKKSKSTSQARYKEGERFSVTGVMRSGRSEYKGNTYESEVFLLDDPINVYVAAYPADPSLPTWHKDVTSATVVWRKEGTPSLVGKRLRVSGIVQAGSKRTPWMEADGTFHDAAGVLMIRDATYEVL